MNDVPMTLCRYASLAGFGSWLSVVESDYNYVTLALFPHLQTEQADGMRLDLGIYRPESETQAKTQGTGTGRGNPKRQQPKLQPRLGPRPGYPRHLDPGRGRPNSSHHLHKEERQTDRRQVGGLGWAGRDRTSLRSHSSSFWVTLSFSFFCYKKEEETRPRLRPSHLEDLGVPSLLSVSVFALRTTSPVSQLPSLHLVSSWRPLTPRNRMSRTSRTSGLPALTPQLWLKRKPSSPISTTRRTSKVQTELRNSPVLWRPSKPWVLKTGGILRRSS